MRKLVAHWVVVALALALVTWVLPGVRVASPFALLAGALVLGLLNAVLRPVLVLLTLPITLLTLGLFYLILNALLFALAAALVPGFVVSGFGSALLGAILLSVISTLLGGILRPAPVRED